VLEKISVKKEIGYESMDEEYHTPSVPNWITYFSAIQI
jgi:hypothetical protein